MGAARQTSGSGPVTEEWATRYAGLPTSASESNHATALAVDAAGNVYVTGTSSNAAGNGTNYATIKYDLTGQVLWTARYAGLPTGASTYNSATALAVDGMGNVYVTGASPNNAGNGYDYATVKYNSAGQVLWTARYAGLPTGASGHNFAAALAVDASGNVYVTGQSDNAAGDGTDYATIKYGLTGQVLWTARYAGLPTSAYENNAAVALAVDAVGNVYVTGTSYTAAGSYGTDYATVKYDAAGQVLWIARYVGLPTGASTSNAARALAVDGAGNVYVTGTSYKSTGTGNDYVTVKYDVTGQTQWTARYAGLPGGASTYNYPTALAVDAAGKVYVTGASYNAVGNGTDYATIAYDATGQALWTARYAGLPTGDYENNVAIALAVDAAGNVYITGASYSDTGTTRAGYYATLKYDAAGQALWTACYAGLTSTYQNNAAKALAVDAAGNVYVTGDANSAGNGYDYATVKYAQQTTTPPMLTVTNLTATTAGQCGASVVLTATATGTPTPTIRYDVAGGSITSPRVFPVGVTSVNATATSSTGSTSGSFTVTVTDAEPPTIMPPADLVLSTDRNTCARALAHVTLGTPVTSDNCAGAVVTHNAPASFPKGTTSVTWTVTDASGNTATAIQRVRVVDHQRPAFVTHPAARAVSTSPGACAVTLALVLPTASDNCSGALVTGARSDHLALAAPFATGTTIIIWTATDAAGNAATDSQAIVVTDNEPPVARTKPAVVTLTSTGQATLTATAVDNGSSDNCGVVSRVVHPNTFSCAQRGRNRVTLTVTDAQGNAHSKSTLVMVVGSPAAAITVVPASPVYTGGVPTTVYLGYGPQCVTLRAPTGGASYIWNGPVGLSNTTSIAPVFTATAAGRFPYVVTITNPYGCTSTAAVTLTVQNVRCGSMNEKIIVCHHGSSICINASSVPQHLLNHHEQLGSCGARNDDDDYDDYQRLPPASTDAARQPLFEVFPNPFGESATLRFRPTQSGMAQLTVYNALGQAVRILYDRQAQAGHAYEVILDGANLAEGLYTCHLQLGNRRYTQRLMRTKQSGN